MTVAVQTTFTASIANGVTTVFPYAFKIADDADLAVTVDGVLQTSGYTVSGVGDSAGGNVTFTVAPANGAKVIRYLAPVLNRPTDYQQFGDWLAQVVNLDFDRLWLAIQTFQQNDVRALKLPIDTSVDQTLTEDAAGRAFKVVGFDTDGNITLFAPVDNTLLAADLANTIDPTKGSKLVGFIGPSGTQYQISDLSSRADNKGGSLIGYSAIASAVAGTLAAAVKNRGVSIKDFPYLAFGDGVTDDTAAINAALAFAADNAALYIPSGTYLCNDNLTADGRLTITGDGATLSIIKFSANKNFTYTSAVASHFAGDQLTIKGVRFQPTNLSTASIIDVNCTATVGDTNTCVVFEDVEVSPIDGTTGFLNGIRLHNVRNGYFSRCRILGDNASIPNLSGAGILAVGDVVTTELHFNDCSIYFVNIGLDIGINTSGVYFHGGTMVGVGVGINQTSAVSGVGLFVSGSHINSAIAAINTSGMLQYSITGNLFYANESTKWPSATSMGVVLDAEGSGLSVSGIVSDNIFIGLATTATTTGVLVESGAAIERINVSGNQFTSFDTAVTLEASTSNVRVDETNSYNSCAVDVADSGTGNIVDGVGSWTPTLTFGGAAVGITYTTQTGKYIRKGNLITVDFDLLLSAKGSSTGAAVIGGLPFTRDSVAWPLANIACVSGGATITNFIGSYVTKSATTIELKSQGAAASANVTDANFTNTTRLIGSVTYTVA